MKSYKAIEESLSTPTVNEAAVAYWRQETLPYQKAKRVLDFLEFNQEESAHFLDVNPSTISRWKSGNGTLSKLSSKMVYDVNEVIKKGIGIFGDEQNFLNWLETPNYALSNVTPKEMIQDPNGLGYVDEALDALAWGAVV
ncbi:antitoxin Xre/MbcA/ParS toxin-binding domain-containing protein [Leeuwenhoekiella polynyae]|uniref:Putative toxin-antitoxin system antitoxin component (TIGR02293 family) n=1 Tax=Leeuwenhoekiella polynyae TaxID=1550906 RepID=A0A4Q0P143_9FLAO|nr:antitoxin Xre/MbcA/ParS toxin-binding domain-containing protein [Leeuwenhoekiella polynyae]RXG20107.1 putative toxin-antitoxin system antitoxin component (TIGR02293 family) [Leeuwenhoekiella polynyae]